MIHLPETPLDDMQSDRAVTDRLVRAAEDVPAPMRDDLHTQRIIRDLQWISRGLLAGSFVIAGLAAWQNWDLIWRVLP